MTRPLLEIADLIRTAGAAFLERNHQWIRWRHVKVLPSTIRTIELSKRVSGSYNHRDDVIGGPRLTGTGLLMDGLGASTW